MMKRRGLATRLLRPALSLIVAAHLVFATGLAGAGTPPAPWDSLADVKRVVAVTVDDDGEARETTIWLSVVDGDAYIRTSRSTRWGRNLVRDPSMVLRVAEVDYPVRVSFIEDEASRDRIIEAFRAKYGCFDGLMQIFRGSDPHIMRLDPRPAEM